ncbi:hypothetical protein B0T21DRAFT_399554 [Apiosordaria backusii]|uniref:Uncharacterized protein n=1 Tax=Apiosordaria backusii TaxID=314023 RepID=A0AA40K497_9PEZI|nr:hypothetical protein B0T21DRAFT_399554 [Apiosordaria backusii]
MLLHRHSSKVPPYGTQATARVSRIRPPGLRLKTSSLDLVPSDEKAQAMASADWRKTAPDCGPSESRRGISDENARHQPEHNDDFYSPLLLEMESMNPEPKTQYRRPRDTASGIAWEAIASAPGWEMRGDETRFNGSSNRSASALNICGPSLQNTMMVRLKAIKPMDVSINGDVINLPNKYSLDVTPVDIQEPDAACFMNRRGGEMLATLKLLKPRDQLRRMKSESHEESVLRDLEDFLSQQSRESPKATTPSKEVQYQRSRPSEHRSSHDSGISITFGGSGPQNETTSGAPPVTSLEGERFQTMLSRLRLTTETKEASQPTAAPSVVEASTIHARALDPAIIVAKVKDKEGEEAPESSDKRVREGTFFGRDSTLLFGKGKEMRKSHDSGYSTFHPMHQTAGESTRTKAVEPFAFAIQKRKEESASGSTTSTKLNPAAAEFKSITRDDIKPAIRDIVKPVEEDEPAPVFTPKRITRLSINNLYPGAVKSSADLTRQGVPPVDNLLAGTHHDQSSPWKARDSHPGPSWAPEPRQPDFPPEMGFQPPVPSVAMAPLPIVDPDGKGARPVFPVTQKPRDHDPVKQQAYESYLEWRKANEPGYHMKCKMRQAHRVVRQYQQQAQATDWKTVSGQAKAAAGALEAKAAEEKKRRREAALKEQFKLSVKMRAELSGVKEKREQPHAHREVNNGKQTIEATGGKEQVLVQ